MSTHTTNAIVATSKLTAIGNAIRSKTGSSSEMTLDQMATAITNIPSGGGSEPNVNQGVIFIDYDGSYVDYWNVEDVAGKSALPSNPSHSGLTAQGWNWTLAQIQSQIQAYPGIPVWVGQMYVTESGATEIDVNLTDPNLLAPRLRVGVDGTVSVDWGDGTSADSITGTNASVEMFQNHTYAQTGNYTIKISLTSGTSYSFYNPGSSYSGILVPQPDNENVNYQRLRDYSCMITSVRIGNNVNRIQSYSFQNCGGLQTVTMPSSITYFGDIVFKYCYSLKSATIPSGRTTIGTNSFSDCRALQSVALPSSLTTISNNVFYGCISLKSITIPSGVTSLGASAFSSCPFKSVVVPDSVTRYGNYVFNDCKSLESITLPTTATSWGANIFNGCTRLRAVAIPSGITSIPTYTVYNCWSLDSITIPSGVTSIAGNALTNCYSLRSVSLPSGVTSIGSSAFSSCSAMESIEIPNTVTSIGSNAFSNCSVLGSITIPSGVTSIESQMLNNCQSLKSITIPSGVTSIGTNAFASCYNVKEYHLLPTTPPTLSGTNAFNNIWSGCKIYVPTGSLSAYQSAQYWSTYASYMQEE